MDASIVAQLTISSPSRFFGFLPTFFCDLVTRSLFFIYSDLDSSIKRFLRRESIGLSEEKIECSQFQDTRTLVSKIKNTISATLKLSFWFFLLLSPYWGSRALRFVNLLFSRFRYLLFNFDSILFLNRESMRRTNRWFGRIFRFSAQHVAQTQRPFDFSHWSFGDLSRLGASISHTRSSCKNYFDDLRPWKPHASG